MINNDGVWVNLHSLGETSSHYHGKFRLKPYLTHGEKGDAQRLSESFCSGITDPAERYFFILLAYSKFHVIESKDAEWWNEEDLLSGLDQEPIFEIFRLLGQARKAVKNEDGYNLESPSIEDQIKEKKERDEKREAELKKQAEQLAKSVI